jgi:hypothetical protein
MSHPYRTTLPQVPSNPQMSVCAWCVHCDRVGRPTLWYCQRREPTGPEPSATRSPLTGRPIGEADVDRRIVYCKAINPDGRCPHYQPTWFTRLAWWRRVP